MLATAANKDFWLVICHEHELKLHEARTRPPQFFCEELLNPVRYRRRGIQQHRQQRRHLRSSSTQVQRGHRDPMAVQHVALVHGDSGGRACRSTIRSER